jgi:hypothetical protein
MSPTGSALAEPAFSTGSSGGGLVEFGGFLGEKECLILSKNFGFDRLGIGV